MGLLDRHHILLRSIDTHLLALHEADVDVGIQQVDDTSHSLGGLLPHGTNNRRHATMTSHRDLTVFEAQKADIQRQLGEVGNILNDVQAVFDNMDEESIPCPTCESRHLGIGSWGPCLPCLETKPHFTWPNYKKGPCILTSKGQRCRICEGLKRGPQPFNDTPSVMEVRKDSLGFDTEKRKCPACGLMTGRNRSLCPTCGASMDKDVESTPETAAVANVESSVAKEALDEATTHQQRETSPPTRKRPDWLWEKRADGSYEQWTGGKVEVRDYIEHIEAEHGRLGDLLQYTEEENDQLKAENKQWEARWKSSGRIGLWLREELNKAEAEIERLKAEAGPEVTLMRRRPSSIFRVRRSPPEESKEVPSQPDIFGAWQCTCGHGGEGGNFCPNCGRNLDTLEEPEPTNPKEPREGGICLARDSDPPCSECKTPCPEQIEIRKAAEKPREKEYQEYDKENKPICPRCKSHLTLDQDDETGKWFNTCPLCFICFPLDKQPGPPEEPRD